MEWLIEWSLDYKHVCKCLQEIICLNICWKILSNLYEVIPGSHIFYVYTLDFCWKRIKKVSRFFTPPPLPRPSPPIPDKQVFRFFTESAKLLFRDNLKNTASILKEPTPTGVSKLYYLFLRLFQKVSFVVCL